jgi:membrane protein required for beta-lactamase induction
MKQLLGIPVARCAEIAQSMGAGSMLAHTDPFIRAMRRSDISPAELMAFMLWVVGTSAGAVVHTVAQQTGEPVEALIALLDDVVRETLTAPPDTR